ncbi:MAG: Uma2 family endonuclease, partial [bacterium]|nr:Uma2 family endonuclease [bacterium]
ARRSPGRYVAEVPRELEVEDLDEQARVYGSRWVEVEDAEGASRFEEVPLTWKDLFDPQEGDRLVHSPEHGKTLRDTGARLDCFYDVQGRDDVAVYDDVRIEWKRPGVDPACPDVAVIPGMKKPKKGRRRPLSFNEKKAGSSPCFVLEVTSKSTAEYDRTKKPEIYRQAGVPEIFLVDELTSPWELSGERRNAKTGGYRKVRPDKRGRLLAETLGVYFSISASGDDLVLEDAATGEVLRKPVAESRARRAAERQVAEEVEAREAAQRQAAEEAEARRKEAEARAAAEATVQELLAKIQRLESSDD